MPIPHEWGKGQAEERGEACQMSLDDSIKSEIRTTRESEVKKVKWRSDFRNGPRDKNERRICAVSNNRDSNQIDIQNDDVGVLLSVKSCYTHNIHTCINQYV